MKTAPRVTFEEVQASIVKHEYILLPDGRTTICMLTLDNGFTVRGESSCVSLANYNEKKGQNIAFQNATDKVWQLLGFRLADRLHQIKLKKGRGKKYRDSTSGLYVTPKYAKLNPDTTQSET